MNATKTEDRIANALEKLVELLGPISAEFLAKGKDRLESTQARLKRETEELRRKYE